MKVLNLFFLFILATICFTSCASNENSSVAAASPNASASTITSNAGTEAALIQIEKDGAPAMMNNDAGYVERTMSEDWVWTVANGMMLTRAQLLSDIKSGQYKFTNVVMDDMKVHAYGETAIVTGRVITKGTYKGQDISGTERFTDTYIKQNGQWRLIASHNSTVPSK